MATFRPRQNEVVYVGANVVLDVDLNARDTVIVDGEVNGEINCGLLVVGPDGVVNGHVAAKEADIAGKVGPTIEAAQLLRLRNNGQISGQATYGELEIEKGAVLRGAHFARREHPRQSAEAAELSRPHRQRTL